MKIFLLILLIFTTPTWAQNNTTDFDMSEDLNVGGDIFSDFNEDLEASQVMEDERFYRYSRFFALNLGLGLTTFTGNRGLAYTDNHPSYHFGLMYFIDFQNVFVMGFEYSRHTMFIDTHVMGSKTQIIGAVQTSMLRPYFGFRYYIDTTDLGTAITYSSPYFVGRMEYWYQTNQYVENPNLSDQSGGGIGTAIGFGLEFPIELKKSYFNIEFLFHTVNFFDKYTQDYRRIPDDQNQDPAAFPSTYGYDDLTGNVYSLFFNYTISW
jgi:hypothetical protein